MIRKFGLGLGLLVVALFAISMLGNGKVSAFYTEYCDVLARPSSPNPHLNSGNCENGQVEDALTSLSGNSDQLKSQFVSKMHGFESGYEFQQVGASYIENGLGGGDWETRLSNPAVTLSEGSSTSCVNTAYYVPSNRVVGTGDCAEGLTTLQFWYNGRMVYEIKEDCGNPLGNLPGLPPYHVPPANKLPIGHFDGATCSAVTGWGFDPDDSSASIRFYVIVNGTQRGSYGAASASPDVDSAYHINGNHRFGLDPTMWSQFDKTKTNTIEIILVDDQTGAKVSLGSKNVAPCNGPPTACPPGSANPSPPCVCPVGMTGVPPSCSPGGGGPTPSNCPGDPTIAANTKQTVTLPDKTPSDSSHGTGSPGGAGSPVGVNASSPGVKYWQDIYQYTVITGVIDKSPSLYGGSADNIQPVAPDKADGTTPTAVPNQTIVNYAPYVINHPYDHNVPTVNYGTKYKETTWTSSPTPTSYTCNAGDSGPNGAHQCAHTTMNYASASCPNGGYVPGNSTYCYTGASEVKPAGGCQAGWYDLYGDGNCYQGVMVNGAHAQSTCPAGYSGPTNGGGCSQTVTTTYNATPFYAYSVTSGPTTQTIYAQNDGYTMNACFNRNFKVNSVNPTISLNDLENPSSAPASATIDVTFSLNYGGAVRQPLQINAGQLTYTASCSGNSNGNSSGVIPQVNGGTQPSPPDTISSAGSITCTVPQPAAIGTTACVTYKVKPTGDQVSETGLIQPAAGNGRTVIGSNCSQMVQNEPYLTVFGGDIRAGNGFKDDANGTCMGGNSNASVLAWNKGSGSYNHGAGTELAALALDKISQFATAQRGGLQPPSVTLPSGLAFANTNTSGDTYGGSLDGYNGCIPDYYSSHNGSSPWSMADGSYDVGPINGLSGTVNPGNHVTIYASGNVFINGPINFAPGASTVKDLPSFTLIAKGNIYISGSVATLNGSYIAQGGTIYDCAPGNGATYSPSQIYPNCSNKLTVNGSFVANDVKFLRAGACGSLRYSLTDSGPGGDPNNCSPNYISSPGTNASEEFDYSPALWLAQPSNNNKPPTYDAITSLPPVL